MEEARRATEIAVRKLSENDYDGAKKFVNKAQRLYPNLDGLKQVSMMIGVYKSASNGGEESDWYRILGVDPLADDEAVKKTYKQLALLLHPDKNKFDGAEGAFKLVLEAWCLLSDKVKRASYDQRRKSNKAKIKMQKSTNQQQDGVHTRKEARSTEFAFPADASKQREPIMLWSICRRCKTEWQCPRDSNLNKEKVCPNCRQPFIETGKTPNKRRTNKASQQQQQCSGVQNKAPEKRTKKASEQKQQWSSVQNIAPDQGTEKASNSSERSSWPSVSFTLKCSSISSKARSNCGCVANQQPKRRLEEFAAEKFPKKARTCDVS
ncbi:PREDICTED: J protein JJJ2-like [Camelina sativa]|uniref:J protein JJJ2-like n=1 Tax=Camelina sativa TaxID=90675 RepID=A0ABM1QIM8_CAMSA|nr:PREDICTED: J protein JJJ2-like [Camelina sativa]